MAKANSFRNNIGTTRVGDAAFAVNVGNAPLDIFPLLPTGVQGVELHCPSANVYVHGTRNTTVAIMASQSVAFLKATSGVASTYIPCARATNLWVSSNVDSMTLNILPIVGIAEG